MMKMTTVSSIGALLIAALAGRTSDAGVPHVLAGNAPLVEQEVGAQLSQLLQAKRVRGRDGMRETARTMRVDVADDDSFEVDLIPKDKKGFSVEKLMALGLDVVRHRKHATTIRATLDQIENISHIVPGLQHIDIPAPAWPMSGEGVIVSGGQIAQLKGARGSGVKIAIIDLGFNGLSNLIEDEDIPAPIATKVYTKTGLEETTNHGTQVAEVVSEMAPDASLILIKIANVSQFVDAVSYAKTQGAKIINVSIGFPGANYGDGTGSAAAALDKAFDLGAIPVVSAGDFGDKHWIGGWADNSPANRVLDFDQALGDEGLTFAANNGDPVKVYLTWNDFPKTSKDLKLEVFYTGTAQNPLPMDATTLQGTSDVWQKGNQAPLEVVAFTAPLTGQYSARVTLMSKDPTNPQLEGPPPIPPSSVQLFVSQPIVDTTLQSKCSIVTPGDSEKSITVGALGVENWLTGPIRSYSSRGPTTSGKDKPDISGPDGVSATLVSPFFGTSAAAPHVAGACAQIFSVQSNLTASDVRARVLAYAEPMGDKYDFGKGRLDLTDDFFPPTPNPPTFDKVETKADATALRVVVSPLNDETGPVQYRMEISGTTGTGQSAFDWQPSNEFLDDGLTPNRQYKYKVQARDSANPQNYTVLSSETKLRTMAAIPPSPDVLDVTADTVKLSLLAGINPSDVEFSLFFVEDNRYLAPDGSEKKTPVWATISSWKNVVVSDLDPATPYQFMVKARNKNGVETVFSPVTFVVTSP